MSPSVDQFFKAASLLMDIKAIRIDPQNRKYHQLSLHPLSLSSLGIAIVFFLMLQYLRCVWGSPVPLYPVQVNKGAVMIVPLTKVFILDSVSASP